LSHFLYLAFYSLRAFQTAPKWVNSSARVYPLSKSIERRRYVLHKYDP
jgi:hypothetical protein